MEAGLYGSGGCRLWLFLAVVVVVGVGCPGGFVLGRGSHTDGVVMANGVEPVHPLGGGEHGRRRCPPKGPGYGISSALYKEFRASARAKPKGVALRTHRGDRLALGQGSPVANRPVLHPTVARDAPGPSGQHRLVSAARRPSPGRPGPGRYTLAGRWSASR